jgi:hypothetical protein
LPVVVSSCVADDAQERHEETKGPKRGHQDGLYKKQVGGEYTVLDRMESALTSRMKVPNLKKKMM